MRDILGIDFTEHDFTKFQDPPRNPIVPVFLGYVGFVGWFWGTV